MRALHKVVTGIIIALGFLHIGFTRVNYSSFDMDAMWFVGAGVALYWLVFLIL